MDEIQRSHMDSDYPAYATVIRAIWRSTGQEENLKRNPDLSAALLNLGIEPKDEVFKLLLQLRNGRCCPLHLLLLRRLVRSPELVRRLDGAVLTEYQIDLFNFEEVFARLTPSFFRDQFGPGVDEVIVWYAADALDQAIVNGGNPVGDIESMRQLLKAASKP